MKMKVLSILAALAFFAVSAYAAVPVGTHVTVRLGQSISSATAHAGDTFEGTVANDVVANGSTIAHAGDRVKGKVTYAKASGRLKDPGVVTVRLTEINGQAVSTTAVSRKGGSHTKGNAVKIGGGAAAGALIGGLAGGGKGAAIGTLAGAGAGTGVAAYTGKKDVTLGAETAYTFTVTASK
jgi:hypothetical protein